MVVVEVIVVEEPRIEMEGSIEEEVTVEEFVDNISWNHCSEIVDRGRAAGLEAEEEIV